ncbi:hypothetical protein LTR10_020392 [Elasticomyces elasticus]|uniref:DNA mismatch repair protein HSM3 N-terminal domain-containing protein n=1 Tax=Exophiala sideris TaxID=1016849 RepID=A0ABR0JLC8_9EURO|nr:hypothetical protein LTR10_020392 [Elasticomyces elasticus]KAK5036392.1 hypothetical protein LTS07_002119 [Exophiala sideris]KAK5041776.1 hypothetical protein LTR13_002443 [Exophiala sideris]KAK5066776.1 hypothetical protein LTR69_002123 [Exophiala sideris]KAK5184834.1 hypothetical protein LTR44_002680 [Eurotiomycetes sp. CCFEE 6388]
MDAIVENRDVLFPEVFAHLAAVESEPQTQLLDEDLLKRAERSLDPSTPKDLLWRLLQTGERLLQILQQDPRPLTRLLERNVSLLPFDELKATISAEKLEEGLNSPSAPVQLLCLAYLRKAADSPSGASFVAASSSLVHCLITVWLSTESTEVGERSLEGIEALLAVDSHDSITMLATNGSLGEAKGQGLLWRRVFTDPDVYSILFDRTSLKISKRDVKTKKGLHLVTISQARLFDFIARLANYNWAAISTSTLPSIEARYVPDNDDSQPVGGLLLYASSHMIDTSDILMKALRQDFFMKLLGVVEDNNTQNVPPQVLQTIQQEAGVDPTKDGEDVGMHL